MNTHLGVQDKKITNIKEISEYFSDSNLLYYGHSLSSSNSEDLSILLSIYENGLQTVCSKSQNNCVQGFISVSTPLICGSKQCFYINKKKLDNWDGGNLPIIIISALPPNFILKNSASAPEADLYKAFYIGDNNKRIFFKT